MPVVKALAQSFFKMDSQSPTRPELSLSHDDILQTLKTTILT